MRRWCWVVGFLVMLNVGAANAAPVCGLGVCIDPKTERPDPPEREGEREPGRGTEETSGETRPREPSAHDVGRKIAGAARYKQGQKAAERRKYDEAIRHFQAAADLGDGGAVVALANVQHKKAVSLFKAGQYLAARRLLDQAIRNDPSSELYSRKRQVMNDRWCKLNRPLDPPLLKAEPDDFDATAFAIHGAKVQRAIDDGWSCDWADW